MKILQKDVGWDKNHYLIENNGKTWLCPQYIFEYNTKIISLIDRAKNLHKNGVDIIDIDRVELLSDFPDHIGAFKFKILDNKSLQVYIK